MLTAQEQELSELNIPKNKESNSVWAAEEKEEKEYKEGDFWKHTCDIMTEQQINELVHQWENDKRKDIRSQRRA